MVVTLYPESDEGVQNDQREEEKKGAGAPLIILSLLPTQLCVVVLEIVQRGSFWVGPSREPLRLKLAV